MQLFEKIRNTVRPTPIAINPSRAITPDLYLDLLAYSRDPYKETDRRLLSRLRAHVLNHVYRWEWDTQDVNFLNDRPITDIGENLCMWIETHQLGYSEYEITLHVRENDLCLSVTFSYNNRATVSLVVAGEAITGSYSKHWIRSRELVHAIGTRQKLLLSREHAHK